LNYKGRDLISTKYSDTFLYLYTTGTMHCISCTSYLSNFYRRWLGKHFDNWILYLNFHMSTIQEGKILNMWNYCTKIYLLKKNHTMYTLPHYSSILCTEMCIANNSLLGNHYISHLDISLNMNMFVMCNFSTTIYKINLRNLYNWDCYRLYNFGKSNDIWDTSFFNHLYIDLSIICKIMRYSTSRWLYLNIHLQNNLGNL